MEPLQPDANVTYPSVRAFIPIGNNGNGTIPEDAHVGDTELHSRTSGYAASNVDAVGSAVSSSAGSAATADSDPVRHVRTEYLGGQSERGSNFLKNDIVTTCVELDDTAMARYICGADTCDRWTA